jgi:membrane-associated protein
MPVLIHQLSYAGVFLFLAGAGIVAPIPEEVTLLTAGYFSARGFLDPYLAAPLAMAGILVGDSVLFGLAKFGSRYARRVHEKFIKMGLERTWMFSPSHPLRSVFFLRFVTGLRMITPIFAGLNGATWIGFLATDFAALLIFVPLIMGLGFYFHANFLVFLAGFEVLRHTIFWTVLALMGGSVIWAHPMVHRVTKHFRRNKVQDDITIVPLSEEHERPE